VADWRVTIVAATGAVTLYRDGVSIQTDSVGATSFPEPPNGTEVLVGPFQNFILVESVELRASIGGAPIIEFDAAAPTGWVTSTGIPTGPPSRAAWLGWNANGYELASSTAFDVAADGNVTWAFAVKPLDDDANPQAGRNINMFFGGGEAGWVIVRFSEYGIDWQFRIGDGATTLSAPLGTCLLSDQVIVVELDRDTDLLTAWVNGTQTGQVDASGLGAVSPAMPLELGRHTTFLYAAAGWKRKLTAAERALLPGVLGA
jgi:hypothetical protein